MNRSFAVVAAVSLVTVSAWAADKKKGADTVAPPAPTLTVPADTSDEVKGMAAALVGRWDATGTLVAEGSTAPFAATWTCVLASGGYAVSCALEGSATGVGPVAETDLFGVDPNTGLFHWFAVTNTGEVHDHWGSCDGKVTTFQYQGSTKAGLYVERITFEDTSDGGLKVDSVTTDGGKQTVHLAVVLARR